jgi:hypothetical protein
MLPILTQLLSYGLLHVIREAPQSEHAPAGNGLGEGPNVG